MSGFTLKSYRDIKTNDDVFYSFDIFDRHEKIHKNLSYFKDNGWEEYTNKEIPVESGIYCIIVTDTNTGISEIAYIGCSKKLNIRLYSHEILRFVSVMLEPYLKYSLFLYKTEDYKRKEEKEIILFTPIFNTLYVPNRYYIKNDKAKRKRMINEYSK